MEWVNKLILVHLKVEHCPIVDSEAGKKVRVLQPLASRLQTDLLPGGGGGGELVNPLIPNRLFPQVVQNLRLNFQVLKPGHDCWVKF